MGMATRYCSRKAVSRVANFSTSWTVFIQTPPGCHCPLGHLRLGRQGLAHLIAPQGGRLGVPARSFRTALAAMISKKDGPPRLVSGRASRMISTPWLSLNVFSLFLTRKHFRDNKDRGQKRGRPAPDRVQVRKGFFNSVWLRSLGRGPVKPRAAEMSGLREQVPEGGEPGLGRLRGLLRLPWVLQAHPVLLPGPALPQGLPHAVQPVLGLILGGGPQEPPAAGDQLGAAVAVRRPRRPAALREAALRARALLPLGQRRSSSGESSPPLRRAQRPETPERAAEPWGQKEAFRPQACPFTTENRPRV